MSVYKKLHDVMNGLEKIDTSIMEFGRTKYAYLSENAITPEVKKLFLEHGLVIIPTHTMFESNEVGDNIHAIVTIVYEIVDIDDGSTLSVTGIGEGMDKGDKAIPKACTAALKQMFRHLLMIPSPDRLDPDNTASEAYRKPQPAPQQKKQGEDPGAAVMKFGNYAGKTLREVLAIDRPAIEKIAKGTGRYAEIAQGLLAEKEDGILF